MKPTIAVALGGGGTRGIAHIGVLRVFEKEGIPIDAVAGTSMGAIVGGLYCSGLSLDQIEIILRRKSFLRAFDTVPIPLRIALIPIFFIPHLFGYHPYDGLYRGNRFANYLTKLVSDDKKEIEHAQPKFWAIASNLLDGEPFAIKTGILGKALQASSAIPALRRPVEMQGALLVDGGILENVPVEHAKQMGCDYVIAIDVDEPILPVPPETFRAIGSVSNRAIGMNLQFIDKPQLNIANIVIHPDLSGIRLLSHKKADIDRAINAGQVAAEMAVPAIKKQLSEMANKKFCSKAF